MQRSDHRARRHGGLRGRVPGRFMENSRCSSRMKFSRFVPQYLSQKLPTVFAPQLLRMMTPVMRLSQYEKSDPVRCHWCYFSFIDWCSYCGLGYAAGLRINTTKVSLLACTKSAKRQRKGDYVIFCPPEKGYFLPGTEARLHRQRLLSWGYGR